METSPHYFRNLLELVQYYSRRTEELPYALLYDQTKRNNDNPPRVGRDDHKQAKWYNSKGSLWFVCALTFGLRYCASLSHEQVCLLIEYEPEGTFVSFCYVLLVDC